MAEEAERIFLSESDVINLILEFMTKRGLSSSQLELERESGVINEVIASPDLVFLRSLIMDGRWDDVLEFLQPLEEAFRSFPGKRVRGTILKHRYLDMMCGHVENCAAGLIAGKNEQEKSAMIEEIVKVLDEFESYCDSKEEYSTLCLLLTSPNRMSEHPEYKDWKSATARLACFEQLRPLVHRFIPPPSGTPKNVKVSSCDRLIQLLIKGLMYEACVEFCQSKAIKTDAKADSQKPDCSLKFSTLLKDSTLSESDLSLLSWLRNIPAQTFGCPFQRRSLRVDVEPLPKPQKSLMNVSIMDSASDLLSRSMASTSFHLSSNEAQADLKSMTQSVDRLFGDPITTDSFSPKTPVNPDPRQPSRMSNVSSTNTFTSQVSNRSVSNLQTNKPPASDSSKTVSSNSFDSNSTVEGDFDNGMMKAKFLPVTSLEDVQAVRCAEFHPSGTVYAIGSNSKTLRICTYPDVTAITENHVPHQPTVSYMRTKHHKGSIYCMGWSPDGTLLATGSNDKTVKVVRFDDVSAHEIVSGHETELSMHDGTVRDLCFVQDKSSLLVSGGAGDCKIYITDCSTMTPFQALSGHTGAILSLCNWGGGIFCSGSQDKTVRFWDLRTRGCIDTVTPLTSAAQTKSPVASVCVEPSGRLMISGHEDAAVVMYDMRGQRQIQSLKTHSADVRSVRFSPAAYYLLSGGYDNRLVLSDLQGDLSLPLPSVGVAMHQDKVISGRWHPTEFTFLSTSADKTSILWALPPEP